MNRRARLVVEILVREQLEETPDREERRAQLVRRVRDERLAGVVELCELDAHSVERVGEFADLVVAAIDDRRVEVAARDALRRGLQPQKPVGEHPGSREGRATSAKHERERRREQQALLDEANGRERVGERRLKEHDRVRLEGNRDVRVVAVRIDHPATLDLAARRAPRAPPDPFAMSRELRVRESATAASAG